jgi:hypothetical protein
VSSGHAAEASLQTDRFQGEEQREETAFSKMSREQRAKQTSKSREQRAESRE